MVPLILMVLAIAFLGGFVVATRVEGARGVRFYASERLRLDRAVERILFVAHHVDFGAFVREEVHHLLERMAHALAHLSLQIVRAAERLLSRVVRYFRSRQAAQDNPRAGARAFVKTLTEFKDTLKATHPDISDIE